MLSSEVTASFATFNTAQELNELVDELTDNLIKKT